MNDTLIVTVFVVLDDLLRVCDHRTDCHARTSDSEVLTVGVIAACQFQNHHERAPTWDGLSLRPALRLALQPSVASPRPLVRGAARPLGRSVRGARGLHPRQHALARPVDGRGPGAAARCAARNTAAIARRRRSSSLAGGCISSSPRKASPPLSTCCPPPSMISPRCTS